MTAKLEAPPKVTLELRPGPVTPAQRQAWRRFWLKLTAEAREASNER